jgi:peptidoglycan/xylan/chitin deacetylase (PgdA/CDA1 family)
MNVLHVTRHTARVSGRVAAGAAWALDFVTDPRRPHQLPWTLYRLRRQRWGERADRDDRVIRPAVLVTFDVERDADQPFVSSISRTAAPFMEAYLAAVAARPYPTTFYVQGGMVEDLRETLLQAAARHEIGLHGFDHELWGAGNWIVRRVPPTPGERRRLLERGFAAFERAGLPAPRSFRAPNFTADRHTYRLLRAFGFATDSSVPTQRGLYREPHPAGITVVPVSVAPTPLVYRNPALRLPTSLSFYQLNYANTVAAPFETFQARVAELFGWQHAHGLPLELVMYAHNWEFFDLGPATPRLHGGLRELLRRLDWLAETYDARFYTIAEWARLRGKQA